MCGRYVNTRNSADLATLLDAVDETDGELAPDYNIAPTNVVPIVRLHDTNRALGLARWGLAPPWPVGSGRRPSLINARVETITTNRAYASAYRSRRCLMPADGWYEWRRLPDGKQPYFITPRSGSPVVFAGLWSTGKDGALTCAVLTTAALGVLTEVHDRMPLPLAADQWADWLSGTDAPGEPSVDLLAGLELRPVSPAVGNVRNDGPSLIDPVAPSESGLIVGDTTDTQLF